MIIKISINDYYFRNFRMNIKIIHIRLEINLDKFNQREC